MVHRKHWVNFTEFPLNLNCTVWIVEPGDIQETLKLSISTGEPQNLRHINTHPSTHSTQESLPTNGEKCMEMTSWGSKDFREGANEHFHSNATFLRSYKSGNIFPLSPSAWLLVCWPWAVPYWGISMPYLLNNSRMTADCGCHELREAIRTALLCQSATCSVVQITNNASSGLSCLKRENLHLDFGVFKPTWVLGPLVPENGLKLCLQPGGRHCLRVGTLCLPSVVGNWPRRPESVV